MTENEQTIESLEDELAESRAETRAAFANRANLYAYLFEELVSVLGKDEAIAAMKRAIYRRGLEVGRKYQPAVEAGDMIEVGRIFCEGSPSGGALFHPGIEESEDGHLVLHMTSCPLVEAWQEMGLPADEIDTLCDIAAAVDEGTFEGAGLDLTFLSRIGVVGTDKCLLDLQLPADE